jgi:hypothetical protein
LATENSRDIVEDFLTDKVDFKTNIICQKRRLTFSFLRPVETKDPFVHGHRATDFVTDAERGLGNFSNDI